MGLRFGRSSKSLSPQPPVVGEVTVITNPRAPTAGSLRHQLFEAAISGDKQKLICLCQIHEKLIFQRKLIWSKLPLSIRSNPRVLHWYWAGLTAVASFCARRLGKPELMDSLRHTPAPPTTQEQEQEQEEEQEPQRARA
jgi:hypothetical protein